MTAVRIDRQAEVTARRGQLHGALVRLEQALTAPVTTEPTRWSTALRDALDRLAFTLADHVEATEAPDGLLSEVERESPWLHARVGQLRREHAALIEATGTIIDRCHDGSPADELREDVVHLLGQLVRHRHAGAGLLYDAYALDLSAGD